MTTAATAALWLLESGISVSPIPKYIHESWTADSKPYEFSWAKYQTKRMPTKDIDKHFKDGDGLAIVCGAISGNLIVLDFDIPGYYEEWLEVCQSLWPEFAPVPNTTYTGCQHVLLQVAGLDVCPGNQKLASHADEDGVIKTAIETRGEGGIIYAPPTPNYSGDSQILQISPEEFKQIIACARSLCRVPEDSAPERMPKESTRKAGEGLRPGDVANEELEWHDLLERDGWTHLYNKGERAYWQRPGKTGRAVSACTGLGRGGQDLLYVFSTNAPVPAALHSKFHYIAITKHGGDYAAATRALADQLGVVRFRPEVERTVAAIEAEVVEPETPETFALTEFGNAERLWAWFGGRFRWIPEWKKFAMWDGKRWEIKKASSSGATEEITYLAVETVRRMYAEAADASGASQRKDLAEWALKCESRSRLASMVELVKAVPGCSVSAEMFDTNLDLINCANGTIDLSTGDLRPHRREDWITMVNPLSYDPDHNSKLYYDTGLAVFDGDANLFMYFMLALGYALTGRLNEQCLFFLYGAGANGKGTLMNTAREAVGPYGGTIGEDTLMAHKGVGSQDTTGLVGMRGKRIVTVTEVEEGTRWNERLIKAATGNDPIEVRELYVGRYSYTPTWTMFVYGNHKPNVRGNDDGIWRRFRMIPFERQFMGAEQDKTLGSRLMEEYELSGVLSVIVNAAILYRKQGLPTPDKVSAATQEYREEMDTMGSFISDCMEKSVYGSITAKELYNTYRAWLKTNGFNYCMHNKAFIGQLRQRGIEGHRTKHGLAYEGWTMTENAPKWSDRGYE